MVYWSKYKMGSIKTWHRWKHYSYNILTFVGKTMPVITVYIGMGQNMPYKQVAMLPASNWAWVIKA